MNGQSPLVAAHHTGVAAVLGAGSCEKIGSTFQNISWLNCFIAPYTEIVTRAAKFPSARFEVSPPGGGCSSAGYSCRGGKQQPVAERNSRLTPAANSGVSPSPEPAVRPHASENGFFHSFLPQCFSTSEAITIARPATPRITVITMREAVTRLFQRCLAVAVPAASSLATSSRLKEASWPRSRMMVSLSIYRVREANKRKVSVGRGRPFDVLDLTVLVGVLPGGLGSKVIRPITLSVVMPM